MVETVLEFVDLLQETHDLLPDQGVEDCMGSRGICSQSSARIGGSGVMLLSYEPARPKARR
jgi:hypothetical protein